MNTFIPKQTHAVQCLHADTSAYCESAQPLPILKNNNTGNNKWQCGSGWPEEKKVGSG